MSTASSHTSREHELDPGPPKMAGWDAVRYRLAGLRLRVSPLWSDVTGFARWLESQAPTDDGSIRIALEDDGAARIVGAQAELDRWPRLWNLLRELGVRSLELDARLESNQVSDVITLMSAERRALRTSGVLRRDRPAARLLSTEGMPFACTVCRLEDGHLSVAYSYCMTRFSRLVTWFKQRQRHWKDHRALFRAAPRYALLLALAPMAVYLLYAFHGNRWLLLATSLIGSASIFALTYIFLMTVGSVEYDNEEKTHNLQRAYAQLKLYADRIRFDMDRARVVQQRLLPDLGAMPLEDRLEWGASFVPQDEVGGDYFDAAVLEDGRMAVLFSDVTGHGLGAALVTAIIKTEFQGWIEHAGELEAFVEHLNQRLVALTPDQSFAAMAVGIFAPDDTTFTYCNCGHAPYPYLIPSGHGDPSPLDRAQLLVLGVLPDISVRTTTLELQPGDTIFFATDGITESEDRLGRPFGDEGLVRSLTEHSSRPVQDLVSGLVDDVVRFSTGSDHQDDRTILAFRVRE